MESYKKCPLKKRPIIYDLVEIDAEPKNLSTKPEDLSIKRKPTEDIDHRDAKKAKYTQNNDNYVNPIHWNTSFGASDADHRSLSPSTDSCASAEFYRETSVSPPAINSGYQNIHLRGLTRQQQAEADLYLQHQHRYWDINNRLIPGSYPEQPRIFEDSDEPQDLSIKSCIPLPALYHNFDRHQSSAEEKSKTHPRFNCQSCGKSYTTFSGLSKHQQFHCPAAECNQVKRLFNCDYCEKSYTTSGALKMHIRTHTRPCKCPTCGKDFSRPWLLQGHIRTHTGEKPFKCQYCARAFADRSNLRAHLQTHAEVKKYVCNICNKSFSRMSLLTKHTEGGCFPANTVNSVGSMLLPSHPMYAV